MIPLTALSGSGCTVPPNNDSPVWLVAAIAVAVGISVLLDRLARKKRRERPSDEEEGADETADGGNTDEK